MHLQALLQHLLEFVAKRERYLCCDETLEYATDASEHDDVDDTLNVLLQHLVHHVRVVHHVHRVGRLDLSVQIAGVFGTEERLAILNGALWQPVSLLADNLATGKGLALTLLSLCAFLDYFENIDLAFGHLSFPVGVSFKNSTEQRLVGQLCLVQHLVLRFVHVSHRHNTENLQSEHEKDQRHEHIVANTRVQEELGVHSLPCTKLIIEN